MQICAIWFIGIRFENKFNRSLPRCSIKKENEKRYNRYKTKRKNNNNNEWLANNPIAYYGIECSDSITVYLINSVYRVYCICYISFVVRLFSGKLQMQVETYALHRNTHSLIRVFCEKKTEVELNKKKHFNFKNQLIDKNSIWVFDKSFCSTKIKGIL